MRNLQAIDFFCGAGGLTRGLLNVNVDVKIGIDLDASCKYAYEYNNQVPFLEQDITTLKLADIKAFIEPSKPLLLAGCAPCQPFSAHASKYKKNADNDSRWSLIAHFYKFVEQLTPKYVIVENVPNMINKDIFKGFVNSLESNGFVTHGLINCEKYGLPQARTRLILIASRQGTVSLPKPTHGFNEYVTVKEVIGEIEPLNCGEVSSIDSLHRCRNLTPVNLKRIKQSKPNGTWLDWDNELLPECYKKSTGATYKSVYGRMSWDKPSPTITTQAYAYGNGRFGHPEQDRALSLREMAMLQTFPKDYRFCEFDGDMSFKTVGRLIGNAVPVNLAEIIGDAVVEHFNNLEIKEVA